MITLCCKAIRTRSVKGHKMSPISCTLPPLMAPSLCGGDMQAGTTAAEALGFKGSSLYLFPVLNSLQKQAPILLQVLHHRPSLYSLLLQLLQICTSGYIKETFEPLSLIVEF